MHAIILQVCVCSARTSAFCCCLIYGFFNEWQCQCLFSGFYFKITYYKNPQLTTTYRQKAPIAQYVRRIDTQIAVRCCAICSIYILPKALGDILTVSILIGGCVFFIRQACVPPFCEYIPTLHRGKIQLANHSAMI